ncbi:MAG TPA: MlaD family protein [Candidatus Binatus sp.]|uniref:MlaD family protein n=1 Tax=Candidatus Binatus sp. TaxID=2811406 RepID=UPI002B4A1606|nr:MlaD family protein [Candidatus Binatus sp.]HKN14328.1 MlaD family protein [Candidatus Binatus sp.]
MGKRINPATVGLFVLGALGLILAAVVVFGSGNLFRKTHEFVIYFAGDINGLRVGAPVKFKGVEIGQVSKIRLRLEQEVNQQNGQLRANVRIPVIVELDEEKILSHGSTIDLSDPHTIPNLIREGLRAQLGSDSFVTGLLYVALDIQPNTPIQMFAPPGAPLQEIPAVPNPLEQAQAVAMRIFERLDKVDFNAVFTQMTGMLESIREITNSPGLKQVVNNSEKTREQLDHTLAGAQQTLSTLNGQVPPLSDSIQKTSTSADAAAKQARITLGTVQTTIEPNSPINYQALQTLQDVSAAAHSIKELADYLQRNPSAIVRGRDFSQD